MRLLFAVAVLALAGHLSAQSRSDTAAVRAIIKNEIETWNKGDAVGYSRDFLASGTFTNIRGQFFTGHPGYLKQHEVIFQGIFKNTTLKQEIVSLKFSVSSTSCFKKCSTMRSAVFLPMPGSLANSLTAFSKSDEENIIINYKV